MEFKLRFLVLPDYIYSDNRLNATDIKVYSFINSYKGDKFYFTNDQLGSMFEVSDDSISRSMVRLARFGYIEVAYKIKSDGGKIRFVRNRKVAESETATLGFEKPQHWGDKDNNIKDNNIKEIVVHPVKKYSSLKDIEKVDLTEIAEKYKVSLGFVELQLEKLKNYCESKGRRYKNYKSALRNFVLGDMQRHIERTNDPTKRAVDARNL